MSKNKWIGEMIILFLIIVLLIAYRWTNISILWDLLFLLPIIGITILGKPPKETKTNAQKN